MRNLASLTVGVLLLATGSAAAESQKTIIRLDGFCNVFIVRQDPVLKSAVTLSEADDNCDAFRGAGFTGRIRGLGPSAIIGLMDSSFPGHQFVLKLDYPFLTGGTATFYGTVDGKTLQGLSQTTYTVKSRPGSVRSDKESITSRVRGH